MSRLNNLSGKDWILFTKSWFMIKKAPRDKEVLKHPAKYPEELVDEFVKFFTFENDTVLDPFLGVGSTIVSAERNNRKGIGFELNNDFYRIAKKRCSKEANILHGDCRDLIDNLDNNSIDFIMTSPPYWNMLSKKRGHSDSQHSDRESKGLKLTYSKLKNDLGNIEDYDEFVKELSKIFNSLYRKTKNGKYMVIVIQNFKNDDGQYMTLAWDIVRKIKKWQFCGEKIWCQDDKKLGIWGYPSTFVTNIHHHYCLVFRKNEKRK